MLRRDDATLPLLCAEKVSESWANRSGLSNFSSLTLIQKQFSGISWGTICNDTRIPLSAQSHTVIPPSCHSKSSSYSEGMCVSFHILLLCRRNTQLIKKDIEAHVIAWLQCLDGAPTKAKPTKELLNSPEMNGICEFQFGASCLRSPPTQKRLKQRNLRGNRAPTHRGECSTGKLSYSSSSSLSCPPQRSADERKSGSARRLRHKQTSL